MRGSLYLKTRKRGGSSHAYMTRQINDPFVKARNEQGYVARSSFKLVEMNEKYQFLKAGAKVVGKIQIFFDFFFASRC